MYIGKKCVYLRLKENLYVRGNADTERTNTDVLMVMWSVGSKIIRSSAPLLYSYFPVFFNEQY